FVVFAMMRATHHRPTIFPYTTLFRSDRGDPNARPQLVQHVSEGDFVKLKSVGRNAKVTRRLDDHHFEVEVGSMKMRVAQEDIAEDRKSTRLNSSHVSNSYAVFCLKKK